MQRTEGFKTENYVTEITPEMETILQFFASILHFSSNEKA
jgi:hypothetical protein